MLHDHSGAVNTTRPMTTRKTKEHLPVIRRTYKKLTASFVRPQNAIRLAWVVRLSMRHWGCSLLQLADRQCSRRRRAAGAGSRCMLFGLQDGVDFEEGGLEGLPPGGRLSAHGLATG